MSDSVFVHEHRVRYQETDQMGVVYHANYLNWFEVGRTEWIRAAGMPYAELERRGLLLPVTELNIQYASPARYDELVNVRVELTEFSAVRLKFDYEARRSTDGVLLVSGWSRHVWVNATWRPARIDREAPELYRLVASRFSEKG